MKLVIDIDRRRADVEDDCETMPGMSRQITRFNADCISGIREMLATSDHISINGLYVWLVEYLLEHGFDLEKYDGPSGGRLYITIRSNR